MTAPPVHASPDVGDTKRARQAGSGSRQAAGPTASSEPAPGWRRWRLPLALIAIIVLGGIVIALIGRLMPAPPPNSYLDPASTAPDGAHALADILGERGFQVVRAYSAADALAALGSATANSPGAGPARSRPAATLIITSPYLLTPRQRVRLSRDRTDLLLVEPGPAALATLAPGVLVAANSGGAYGQFLLPRCNLAAATQAGSANVGGFTYRAPARAVRCYPVHGNPSLTRYAQGGRTIIILGSGAALTNNLLGSNGNAALALNLLNGHRRIVWLTAEPAGSQPVLRPGGPQRSGPSLIPWPAWLLVIQLFVAALLVALWRARRLGPLITERLPVVIRASETVEGHARLYQSRRARGRAAAALREAMLARVLPTLGLVTTSPPDAVTDAIEGRSRLGRPDISRIIYGPDPATDSELVHLARSLDELEREVLSP